LFRNISISDGLRPPFIPNTTERTELAISGLGLTGIGAALTQFNPESVDDWGQRGVNLSGESTMRTKWVIVIVFVTLMLVFVFFRSRKSENQLDVDPNAKGEIEKARGR
jgi:hypothetical protein